MTNEEKMTVLRTINNLNMAGAYIKNSVHVLRKIGDKNYVKFLEKQRKQKLIDGYKMDYEKS